MSATTTSTPPPAVPPRSTSRSTERRSTATPLELRRATDRAARDERPDLRRSGRRPIDGTVYAAYFGRRAGGLSDVVVARDDDWAAGATSSRLLDSGDGPRRPAGRHRREHPVRELPDDGMERLVASDLSIAVDPRDSRRVWVAGATVRPHGRPDAPRAPVDRRPDRSADLRTVANAKAPVVRQQPRAGRVPLPAADGRGPEPALADAGRPDGNDFGHVRRRRSSRRRPRTRLRGSSCPTSATTWT